MKTRFVLSLIIFAVLLSSVLLWISAQRVIEGITQDVLSRPQALIERWVSDLSTSCPESLATLQQQAYLLEYWYFQVFTKNNPRAWVDVRAPQGMNLQIARLAAIPFQVEIKKLHPEGSSAELFDIVAPIKLNHGPECNSMPGPTSQPPDRINPSKPATTQTEPTGYDGYIRLGFSEELLRGRITLQIVQLVGITLVALLLFSLIVWLAANRLFPAISSAPATTAVMTPGPTTSSVPLSAESSSITFSTPETKAPSIETALPVSPRTMSAKPITEFEKEKEEVPTDSLLTEPPVLSAPQLNQQVMTAGNLVLDDMSKQAQIDGQLLTLTPKEYDILKLLASQPGRVFSNEEILKNVWKDGSFASSQDVKQYVYFLRRKIEKDPQNPQRLVTVRGFGYKLNP
ncbi:winged helix-turn-helix transcriptional regulator [Candidatus Acetothermia bacterium]|nr:winged helix-turn-helix transcriptional regulator [Candidatus Acetothermia bacterium]